MRVVENQLSAAIGGGLARGKVLVYNGSMKVNIYEKFLNILFVFVAMVLFASVAVFDGGDASALTYSSDTDIEFTFNSVISINLSSPNLVISDLAPGEYSDSNIITVGANTNASMGYQLSATVGQKNGTDALVNTTSSSNTFANLTSTKATLANFTDNTWGYSYCADTSANCGSGGSGTWVSGNKGSTTAGYAGLPLDNNTNASDRGLGGVLLLNTSGPEDTIQSVQFKIGAKASNNQASGDYTNTINFYAVANPEPQLGPVSCTAGKICYNENALSGVEGTMGQQSASDGNTVTLLASNFSRNNYGFAGWNTAYDYSGTFYGPQEDITVPTGTTTNGYSLYAVWVKSVGTMQANAGSVCSGLTIAPTDGTANLASVSALTDQRDNQTYAIAKLADGKCWMIENLRLESTNSDNSTGTLAQGYGTSATYGNFSGLADAEFTGFSFTYSANSLYYSGTQSGTATIDISTSSYPGYRMPRYNNLNTQSRASSPTSNTFAEDNTTGGMYSYGNYYTWHAAIADLTYNGTSNQSTTGTSLCPAGWHLPTGGMAYASGDTRGVNVTGDTSTFREFYNLGYKTMDEVRTAYEDTPNSGCAFYSSSSTNAVGNTAVKAFRSFPNNFLYSGSFSTSSAQYRGNTGSYWSSTACDKSFSCNFGLSSVQNVVSPGTNILDKPQGLSIRCIASAGS